MNVLLRYEGEWLHGKKEGKGTITLPDGSKYRGQWKDGQITGTGVFTLSPDSDLNNPDY